MPKSVVSSIFQLLQNVEPELSLMGGEDLKKQEGLPNCENSTVWPTWETVNRKTYG